MMNSGYKHAHCSDRQQVDCKLRNQLHFMSTLAEAEQTIATNNERALETVTDCAVCALRAVRSDVP